MGASAKVGSTRFGVLLLIAALAAIILVPAVASAATLTDADELGRFGSEGTGVGQLSFPGGSAADPVTGHLYVDAGNNRINEYTPWGEFVKAFGWDVAPGAVNEQQEVRVRAGAGTFKLTFGANTTADLSFDATAAEVQSALNGLASIGGAGGSVAVTALPGKAETATPYVYVVVFKGSLATTDVAQLMAANGATPLSAGNPKTELEVRTRADGTPGGTGLESCTEESGCQEGSEGGGAGQFNGDTSSLATDAAGGLYVAETTGFGQNPPSRIQKLSPAGRFLWAIGGDTIVDGAAGTGIVTPGSVAVADVTTTEKVFRANQAIEGTGIEPGTKIVSVEGFGVDGLGKITLSQPAGPSATGTTTNLSVKAGSNNVPSNEKQTVSLGANTTGGTFGLIYSTPSPSHGRAITGGFVGQLTNPPATAISATATTTTGSSTLTSTAFAIGSGTLIAGSNTLKSFQEFTPIFPEFSVGQGIAGTGIPAGTKVTAVSDGGSTLTLSANATASGSKVAVSPIANGTATTTAGSNQITAVTTASGTGTLIAGSTEIKGLSASSGEFQRGQTITGEGIPGGTGTGTLVKGSKIVTGLVTLSGSFHVSEKINGSDPFTIEGGTTIAKVEVGQLELSRPAERSGSVVPLSTETKIESAGLESLTLSVPATASGAKALSAGVQPFAQGQAISGPGIPTGTKVLAVGVDGRSLTLSAKATASATGVAVSGAFQPTVSPGEEVSGTGIPVGTTIEAVAANGDLTLSANATASATGTPLRIGIPYNASAATLQSALEGLPNIGAGNVAVTGSPGGPWTVEFKGARFAGTDVEQMTVSTLGLTTSSGKAEASVTSANGTEVCRAAPECQMPDLGTSPGQFPGRAEVAVAPGGGILVATKNLIERFNAEGEYQSQIELPKEVNQFAVNPASGDLYVVFAGEVKQAIDPVIVRRLDPATGSELGSFEVRNPYAFATNASGDLFVVRKEVFFNSNDSEPELVLEYGPEGKLVSSLAEVEAVPGSKATFNSWGIGTNALGDLYVTNHLSSSHKGAFLRFFGPPPVSFEPPPLRAPQITAQYAVSVGTSEVALRAKVNPRFWNDTSYHAEYGTSPCNEGGCSETAEANLSHKVFGNPVASHGVFLEGLEAGTTYHYRFVAHSTGGGPVWGVDSDGEGPKGPTFADGAERTFTTARAPAERECPENEAFRTETSAFLPDCRAYEMVSPLGKEGADVVVGLNQAGEPAMLDQSSEDGNRLAYGSYGAFAGAESAPHTVQYIASRNEGEGWATHPIVPPYGQRIVANALRLDDSEFKAFSPDLCQAWLQNFAEVPGAAGAPAGVVDVYRRTDNECGGPAYEPLNAVAPSVLTGEAFRIELQGLSDDGSAAVFVADDKLAEGGIAAVKTSQGGYLLTYQLYASGAGQPHLVCVLPDGGAWGGGCTAGSNQGGIRFGEGNRRTDLTGALSEDGSRVYWSATSIGEAPVYLRENPTATQSALAHGGAAGGGKLTEGSTAVTSLIAAKGKASIVSGSTVATLTEAPSVGQFAAGQPLNTVSGIEAGTKIVSCSPECGPNAKTLTLSKAATASKEVTLTSKGPMPFAAGQTISAPGIALGTTITAVKEGELTLSKAASASASGVSLEAFSECTEAAKACTLAVSAQAEAESGSKGSTFWAAAKDGSKALFTTGVGGNGKLYEYRVADRSTHLIAGKVVGLVGQSKDLSRVYLASTEALTAPGEENENGEHAEADKSNLYLYEGGSFRFIGGLGSTAGQFSPIANEPAAHTATVSADGLHAAFMAQGSPTGYDNTDVNNERADPEVYLYDAAANGGEGKLVCASCNPSGARPVGSDFDPSEGEFWAAAQLPVWESSLYQPRALSEDGSRLFFQTSDSLVPRDTNGVKDVYEWEAPEAGTCEESTPSYSPQNGGCVDLVSSGKSSKESSFVDASPDGHDVFFATLSSLLPQDFGLVDIYDARENGGFPAPQSPPAACEGEACQSAPEAPNDPTPASSSFEGAGNVKEEPSTMPTVSHCAKGKVKRHGKCVAKKHKHAHKRSKRNRRAGR